MPRTASTALKALMAATNPSPVDLWTFVLASGTQRWTNHTADITISGDTWHTEAPVIVPGGVRTVVGTEVSILDVSIAGAFQVGGVRIAALAATGAFDDVYVIYERAYLPSPTEKLFMFSGHVFEIEPASTKVTLAVKCLLAREDEIPRRQLGPMCQWVWGDSRCTVTKATYQASDTINATGTTQILVVLVTGTSGNIRAGSTIRFADGTDRGIVDWNGTTKVARLDSPLSYVPSGSVTIWKGCLKTLAECDSYSKLDKFSGFPFLPL